MQIAIRTKKSMAATTRVHAVMHIDSAKYSCYHNWDHELNTEQNHKAAAEKLLKKEGFEKLDLVGARFAAYEWYWVPDCERLDALKGIVNSMRKGTWSGSPWGREEFRKAAGLIGESYGFHGSPLDAPTNDEQARELGLIE